MWDDGVGELWKSCGKLLREQVSDATWMACFDTLDAAAIEDDRLVLTTSSPQARDKLERSYRAMIAAAVEDVAGQRLDLVFVVRPPERVYDGNGSSTSDRPDWSPRRHGGAGDESVPAAGNRTLGNRTLGDGTAGNGTASASEATATDAARPDDILNPRYTFDAFVIGDSNRFAHAAARGVAETRASAYNPLFIYGESGLGKTHLLHAIGHYVRENFPASHVRYVSTEAFMNEFVDSIRSNSGLRFKRRYRACDVLLVDDIQFLENKEGLQEEFFHTFNSLHEVNKQIVLTSDRPPRSIATLEDRLRSRFDGGLITDIQRPDLETRLAILRKKADGERPHVPNDVLELIATHVKDNIRELEGALIRVSAFASLNREPLTIETAEKVLADILAADRPRQITPRVILEATASTFGFTIDELCGTSRRRPLVNARQISMYVFRDMTDFSYPAIAREFGGRDHTTVIHAVEKISGLMKERRQVYDQVTQLIQRIRSGE